MYRKASGFSASLILAEFCHKAAFFVAGITRTFSTFLRFMEKLSQNWKRSFLSTWTWTFMVSAFKLSKYHQLYVFLIYQNLRNILHLLFFLSSKGDVQLLWNQFSELHEPQVSKAILMLQYTDGLI